MTTILDKFNLAGKVAVVTGGAGLLGKEFCRTLSEAGASVVVADFNQKVAFEVARQLQSAGYKAIGSGLDVTCPGSAQGIVDQTIKEFAWPVQRLLQG